MQGVICSSFKAGTHAGPPGDKKGSQNHDVCLYFKRERRRRSGEGSRSRAAFRNGGTLMFGHKDWRRMRARIRGALRVVTFDNTLGEKRKLGSLASSGKREKCDTLP